MTPVCAWGDIFFTEPSSGTTQVGDGWQTQNTSIGLHGYLATPPEFSPSNCPSDNGYSITWLNETNHAAGTGGAYSSLVGVPFFGVICVSKYGTAEIPLAMGANHIVVTAVRNGTTVGQDCADVQRLADTTPPTVNSTSPANGAASVSLNGVITAFFSEPMAPSTLNATTFLLSDQLNNAVAGVVTVDQLHGSAIFTPSSALIASRVYTATITTGVQDEAGNNLAANYSWTFTTGSTFDNVRPTVDRTTPAANESCFDPGDPVTAVFSESMEPTTVTSSTFLLNEASSGDPVQAVVNLDYPTMATLTPNLPLSSGTSYRATITTGVKDLAGNALNPAYNWSFNTVAADQVGGQWAPTATTSAPYPRSGHVAVWTGSQMIVAGGFAYFPDFNTFGYTDTGGRYDPITNTWLPIATGAPATIDSTAVWTGTEMIVWGGGSASGKAYNPSTDTWRSLPTANAPMSASQHTAIWTGTEMIVWGGLNTKGSFLSSGARYDPVADKWTPISFDNAPSARRSHTAVWTGAEMIVWGGLSGTGQSLPSGGRYNPTTDTWMPMSNAGAPSARWGHGAVWTGTQMIVWGEEFGRSNTGGRYTPATDSWLPTSTICAPVGRESATVIWAGDRMVVWGGWNGLTGSIGKVYERGAEYDPVTDTWRVITTTGAPSARYSHTSVWSGTDVIVWGGRSSGNFNTGGKLRP